MIAVAGTEPIDRIAEVSLAAATVVAIAALAVTFPALTRKRKASRTRLTPALVIATGGAAIAFVAYLAFQLRCTYSGCGVKASDAIAGIYPWWRVDGSWQWGAQLAVASVGLMFGALALALAAREKGMARRALLAARLTYGIWVVVAFVLPAAWELIVI